MAPAAPLPTHFAPPERMELRLLAQLAEKSLADPVLRVVLESLDGHVLVLNRHRQILAANPSVLKDLQMEVCEALVGLRPGEAFGCMHLPEAPSGCGTSAACRNCGLVLAVLAAQAQAETVEGECLMALQHDERFGGREFHVKVTPLDLDGEPILVAVLHDISDTRRREVLEASFLHDLSNVLQGLSNWTELLRASAGNPARAAQQIAALSQRINEEVAVHRMILQAERGELLVHPQPLLAHYLLEEVCLGLEGHEALKGKVLEAEPIGTEDAFWADPTLLRRVLTNMLVNALEASPPGSHIRIAFDHLDGLPRFRVHNPGTIPPEACSQMFHRAFSTKAAKGRGLGTYAMKLLGENHLRGQVGFSTSEAEGTCFWILLPRATHLRSALMNAQG